MNTSSLEKTYDPKQIESRWYDNWEQAHYFKPATNNQPYCIMIPPPNITGTLHMGHAFEATLIDTMIRYHRMQGDNTLWQVGTDHAGIATQMVVERQLEQEGSNRQQLGREEFTKRIWQWKQQSGNEITKQLRRMGASGDWSRERFTMDDSLVNTVQDVFIRLYDDGLIYRGKRLVNWDPVLHTAISDLEVINSEESGQLWHINYPLVVGDGYLTVATTRPETLFGDVAVAVHPDDERYQELIGQYLRLPLTDRDVPIIADEYVEQDFGTGCLKITPAHDFNDYELGKRHGFSPINIFTIDAKCNDNVPDKYRGLSREDAREQVLADLQVLQLLAKTEEHTLTIPRCERSGVIVEPYLTDQWYVRVQPLAEPAIAAVQQGRIRFIPQNWENTYFSWMNDLEDWCISRQLWWGHRIPAWYDNHGQIYVGNNIQNVRSKYQLAEDLELHQDPDVLDTWFSSALWPFSTLDWPTENSAFNTFYPTNALVTGFDIIFFWVARMIMMGLKLTGEVPFRDVYIHGLIRDGNGQKMSKSKGNVIDPIDLIDGIELNDLITKRTSNLMQLHLKDKIIADTKQQFPDGITACGTDALRLTFCSLASTSRDIQFDPGRTAGCRNFCNKLWNAARFVLMNVAKADSELGDEAISYSVADRWMLSLLQQLISQYRQALDNYRFDLAAQYIYEFVWHEYCDWYLELSKPMLTNPNSNKTELRGTKQALVDVLETILRLSHPIIPFITEEIWQAIAPMSVNKGATIMTAPFPEANDSWHDGVAETHINWLKQIIVAIRTVRAQMNISPKKKIPVLLKNLSEQDNTLLIEHNTYLCSLAKIAQITVLKPDDTSELSATTMVGKMEIMVPLAGLIDRDAELARLSREVAKIDKELAKIQTKLANVNYVNKAPAAIVNKERARQSELQTQQQRLQEKLAQFKAS